MSVKGNLASRPDRLVGVHELGHGSGRLACLMTVAIRLTARNWSTFDLATTTRRLANRYGDLHAGNSWYTAGYGVRHLPRYFNRNLNRTAFCHWLNGRAMDRAGTCLMHQTANRVGNGPTLRFGNHATNSVTASPHMSFRNTATDFVANRAYVMFRNSTANFVTNFPHASLRNTTADFVADSPHVMFWYTMAHFVTDGPYTSLRNAAAHFVTDSPHMGFRNATANLVTTSLYARLRNKQSESRSPELVDRKCRVRSYNGSHTRIAHSQSVWCR